MESSAPPFIGWGWGCSRVGAANRGAVFDGASDEARQSPARALVLDGAAAIGGAAHTARWGSCPSYSAARNPPPLSSLRSETGAVPRLGGGCTQATCFFSISSAAGSTSTASCCFPLRVLVGFCKSSALTASRACVCGILQVRSTVNCSRHHHAR